MSTHHFRKFGGKGVGHQAMMEGFATAGDFLLALSVSALPAATKKNSKAVQKMISYLRKHGYVLIKDSASNRCLVLTPQGKKRARYYAMKRISARVIARPKHWDGKWRIIMFDIATEERTKRNAFRSLIQRLGAAMLQKSVWIHPFDCAREVEELKSFFGLSSRQVRVIVGDIGDDREFRKLFKL